VLYQRHASTVGVCASIYHKYGIEVIPHFLCGGFNQFETQDALFDLIFVGIDNVMAVRGDPRKNEDHFVPKELGHRYASQLVQQLRAMENDQYTHSLAPDKPINLCIGVAGYPEKHHESQTFTDDMKWLKHKVDCGADYIVTQMFYEFDYFVAWEKKCREAGITIPIIPGIKPITRKKHLRRLAKNFNLTMPESIISRMEACKTRDEAFKTGISLTVELCNKLIDYGVPGIHLFSMESGLDVAEVAKQVF